MNKNERQPMQPIVKDDQGIIRFQANAIVRRLLDEGGIDLNRIALWIVPQADIEQFNQLIGYSVCGYCDLSSVSDESKEDAWEQMEKVRDAE